MNKFYISSILSFVLLSLITCNTEQKKPFDDKFITVLAADKEPSLYMDIPLFCMGIQGKVLKVESADLKMLYEEGEFSMKYSSFLNKVLNQELIIDAEDKVPSFVIDRMVMQKYQSNSLLKFFNSYFSKTFNDKYFLTNELTNDQINSVLYFLFINGYLSTFDDYMGSYTIFKADQICKLK